MSAQITLKPSGHRYIVEQGETILEAALRSGLAVKCSCINGSCGQCKARVLEGEVATIMHHDYVLTEAEKLNGTLLLCRAMPASDMVIEASEAAGVEDIPMQDLDTVVSKLEKLSADILVLHLRTPRSSTLRFLAGQHVTLHIGELPPRNKSVASCPCNGMVLQFHIRRVPGDPFSEYVFSQLKLRDRVKVRGPEGRFVLDESSRRPLIFLAYETGFAPIRSLIEHVISLELPQPMRLYWVVRHPGEHYQANYCRALQDALDDFVYTPLTAADGNAAVNLEALGVEGEYLSDAARAILLAGARVVQDFPVLNACDVYVNGPEPLVGASRDLLLQHGLPEERLFVDHIRRY